MSRQIRRTLDLNTIARQTVKGLAEALGVSRCFICLYNSARNCVQVTAEYCPGDRPSLLGWDFLLEDYPDWQRALDSSEAIAVETLILPGCAPQAALIFATRYQDRPNALVCLCQEAIADGERQRDPDPEPDRTWGAAEIEFVRELGEQVGTAIAHATLYQELEQAREQAEAASKLKSQFLANTSHELRTPLNGMIGFLKLIMEGMAEDEEEEKQFIEEAYRSALHLLNLINDILDIAKIEAGKMHLDLNPVNLGELVTTVENHTRALVQQKNLTLQIQLPETEDEILLYGNYQRLLQVMLNIVGNAIKFTHEGGIEIRATIVKNKVEVRGVELPGVVQISVTDTGIGVSLDKQDKLFQSFSQVDSDRTRQYGGTGLGLAISQKLIEAMGGRVNFYSLGEGLGSTVTFVVPLYQEPAIVSLGSPDSLDLLS
jgi:signal transduction histidine kinase